MNPTQVPQATPAPLHDIAGPVSFFSSPLWIVLAVGLVLFALIGLGIWLARRRKSPRPLTPKQRALASIEDLRREGADADPYAFGVRVSDALRTYIRDQFGLDAVTRTSVEFLEALRHDAVFSDNEKAAMSEFLESVDLLKYARHAATSAEIAALLEVAERLVNGDRAATPVVP